MAERIGFIGVGFMGHGMAKNLVEKGHPLTVLGHRNRAPVDDLVKRGAKEAKTAEEVAKNSDIIFMCVSIILWRSAPLAPCAAASSFLACWAFWMMAC